ncbi:MAG: hypothetical protein WCQ50_19435, partial [Spirochaetota bacterium]
MLDILLAPQLPGLLPGPGLPMGRVPRGAPLRGQRVIAQVMVLHVLVQNPGRQLPRDRTAIWAIARVAVVMAAQAVLVLPVQVATRVEATADNGLAVTRVAVRVAAKAATRVAVKVAVMVGSVPMVIKAAANQVAATKVAV